MVSDEFSEFKAPFISKVKIQEAADEFRNKYWSDNDLPIDIEHIIEIDLGIQIIPVKNLLNEIGIDAFISQDFRFITIDEDIYFKDNNQNLRRFSLGHEIGHYVLHKSLYKKLSFKTEADWIEFIGLIPETEYSFIEYHAYEFSGKLLVPKVQLIRSLKEAKSKLSSVFENNSTADFEMIKSYVFSNIGREFLVSEVVIEKRINSEQIIVNEIFEFF